MNIDEISINIHAGADGKRFWSEIVQNGAKGKDTMLWEQIETSETRTEALDRAENALDRMIEAEEKELELAAEDRSMGLTRTPREDFKDE